jgi:tetratricopeptide (TPR) repeat protein
MADDREAKLEKVRRIVAATPGAEVFTDGMKLPGQEEREERDAEWNRGEFDPVGDLVVTGIRLKRGEGRAAGEEGATPGEHDDVIITLRGSPAQDAADIFFAPRGTEALLASREETHWLVELSNPALSEHWRKALQAMQRGDTCRFTCAAKKSQAWLQSLADCCEPLESDGHFARVAVPPSNRSACVEMRVNRWVSVAQVAPSGSQCSSLSLFKRTIELPHATRAQMVMNGEQHLREQLRHAGDYGDDDVRRADDESFSPSAINAVAEAEPPSDGRRRRRPRPPDRVRLQYVVRARPPKAQQWVTIAPVASATPQTQGTDELGNGDGGLVEFSLGASGRQSVVEGGHHAAVGGPTSWPVFVEACQHLEEGERATFRFTADVETLRWMNLSSSSAADRASSASPPSSPSPSAPPPPSPSSPPSPPFPPASIGDLFELDLRLDRFIRQLDISRCRDLTVAKCKLTPGVGFWRPRTRYIVEVTAAATAPHTSPPSKHERAPPQSARYTFELGVGSTGSGPLSELVATMSLREVSLLTALRARLVETWPAGGPLSQGGMPPASEDGYVTLWVRLEAMTRVEAFGGSDGGGGKDGDSEEEIVVKETHNGPKDIQWLEDAYVSCKGTLPMLEEDVSVVFSAAASDGDGRTLFTADRRLSVRMGDVPLAEEWVLQMLMSMYAGERATVRARGERAVYLLCALCQLRSARGGCRLNVGEASAQVKSRGLKLSLTILDQQPPAPRDGVSGAMLLAAADDLKQRANALLNAGYTAGAMRKYVRATWLMQDGKEKDDPSLPMTAVIGVGRGPEPRVCRFEASQAAAVKTLRVSLHLNLAAGALKLGENYGALAAARVARELEPKAVKPLYREAQAHLSLASYDEAREALKLLLEIEPSNMAARKLREAVRHADKSARKEEAGMFEGLFHRAKKDGPLYSDKEIEQQQRREREKTEASAKAETTVKKKEAADRSLAADIDMTSGVTEQEMADWALYMNAKERKRVDEWQAALVRAKQTGESEGERSERERRQWAELAALRRRVTARKTILQQQRGQQEKLAQQMAQVTQIEEGESIEKLNGRAEVVRRLALAPFDQLFSFLSASEKREVEHARANPVTWEKVPMLWDRLQQLLVAANQSFVEARVDEVVKAMDKRKEGDGKEQEPASRGKATRPNTNKVDGKANVKEAVG